MACKQVTKQQYHLYMGYRKMGYNQEKSAAKSGMSLSSAKRHEKHGFKEKAPRTYRTRPDPLQDVWDSFLVPLLKSKPTLSPITLFDYLEETFPGKYSDKIKRTLQRRVKIWKAHNGPDKEIMFEQTKSPGDLALSDFTELKDVEITIKSVPLKHRLYHFRLAFSGWSYLKVIHGGESFTALAEGLQTALWRLGGSPKEHRTDSLSAAFKNLSRDEKRDVTKLYSELCSHYNIKPTRNNLGKKHENGSIESSHGHMKRRIKQSLILRGSNDFETVEKYQLFIDEIVQKHNRNNSSSVIYEKKYLQDLPLLKTTDYTTATASVASTGTIKIRNHVFSVPPRLVGETLKIHIYDDRFECYLGSDYLFKFTRFKLDATKVKKVINYKHMLSSLLQKPGAFGRSKLKYDILPSNDYKEIWNYLEKKCERQQACKIIVGILQIANESNKELAVGLYVKSIIEKGKIPYIEKVRAKFLNTEHSAKVNNIVVMQHDLESYNELLNVTGGEDANGS